MIFCLHLLSELYCIVILKMDGIENTTLRMVEV